MFVYCIENLLNHKKYVGVTTKTINERFKKHKAQSREKKRQHLHKAMAQDGIDNFIIYEIDNTSSIEELYEKEKHWIKTLDTKNNGYNETDGGEGSPGVIFTEERLKQMSKFTSERMNSSEERKRISETTKKGMERWWNDLGENGQYEYRKRVSEGTKKGLEEWKKSLSEHEYNEYISKLKVPRSQEFKNALSKRMKGRIVTEHQKELISKANKGKLAGDKNPMKNPENRAKLSEKAKNRYKVTREDGTWYWGHHSNNVN